MCVSRGQSQAGPTLDGFTDPRENPMTPAEENAIIEQMMRREDGAQAPFGAYGRPVVTSDQVNSLEGDIRYLMQNDPRFNGQ